MATSNVDVAEGAQSPRPVRIWLVYLLIWFCALVPLIAIHLLARPAGISLSSSLFAGVANLFGPFATFALKLSGFPNAGSFPMHYLPHACVVTAALIVVILLPLFFRQRPVRIGCIAALVLVLMGWLALGFYQIAACAT